MTQKLLYLLIVGFTTTMAQKCPPAALLAPCECNEEELVRFQCDSTSNHQLKQVFDAVSPLIPEDMVFDELRIWFYSGAELGPDTIRSLKFRNISIEYGADLQTIHPDAFSSATYETTRVLRVANNKLSAESSSSIFPFFNKFKNLEELTIGENHLTSIPGYPFDLLPYLRSLVISSCGLVRVGSTVFPRLVNLENLSIRGCELEATGFDVDAFARIGSLVVLDLRNNNRLDVLPEAIFKRVMDGAAGLEVGGRECVVIGQCYDLKMRCDEEATGWLCRNQTSYERKLTGYLCQGEEEEEGYDVWDWCRDNNNATL